MGILDNSPDWAKKTWIWWIGSLIVVSVAVGGGVSWLYETFRIPHVERTIQKGPLHELVDLPAVFDIDVKYFQTPGVNHPRWLRGLAEYQKGEGFAVIVTQRLQGYNAGKVSLTSASPGVVTGGYAFLIRRADNRDWFEGLPRRESAENQYVIRLPATQPNDELLFLVAVTERLAAAELQNVFALRKME